MCPRAPEPLRDRVEDEKQRLSINHFPTEVDSSDRSAGELRPDPPMALPVSSGIGPGLSGVQGVVFTEVLIGWDGVWQSRDI